MVQFSSVRSALHYTACELIPPERGYIINIDGSDMALGESFLVNTNLWY